MKTLDLDGTALNVLDHGSGPPILLVHGFPLDHSMWHAQIEALAGGWRVIAPDLPGFGASPPLAGPVTMERCADHLVEMLDALGVNEPVVLCGLSMGGYVAFQFWQRHAGRLAKMVLCDTRAAADAPEAAQGRYQFAEQIITHGMGVAAETMLPKLIAPATTATSPQTVEKIRSMVLAASPAGAAEALKGMAVRADMRDLLSEMQVKTLVIVGEDDAISPPEEMREIATAMPDAELVIVPMAGHMSPMENATAFNTALLRFLAE